LALESVDRLAAPFAGSFAARSAAFAFGRSAVFFVGP